jgi:hypothetical protein
VHREKERFILHFMSFGEELERRRKEGTSFERGASL